MAFFSSKQYNHVFIVMTQFLTAIFDGTLREENFLDTRKLSSAGLAAESFLVNGNRALFTDGELKYNKKSYQFMVLVLHFYFTTF